MRTQVTFSRDALGVGVGVILSQWGSAVRLVSLPAARVHLVDRLAANCNERVIDGRFVEHFGIR